MVFFSDSVFLSAAQKEYDAKEKAKKEGKNLTEPEYKSVNRLVVFCAYYIVCGVKGVLFDLIKEVSQSDETGGILKNRLTELEKSADRCINDYVKLFKTGNSENKADCLEDLIQILNDLILVVDSYNKSGKSSKQIDVCAILVENLILEDIKANLSNDNIVDIMDIIYSALWYYPTSAEDIGKTDSEFLHLKEHVLDEEFMKRARERMRAYMVDTAESIKNKAGVMFEDAVNILSEIWDSMIDCAESLATAANSTCSQITGTHMQSLDAERANQTKMKSKKLEDELIISLRGGRIEMEKNAATYDEYQKKTTDPFYRYLMNEDDVMAKATKPEAQGQYIVPLQDVIVVARKIMTQMHLDAVGMGAYLTLVINREEFRDTEFSQNYINEHVLLIEKEAKIRYNDIINKIDLYTPKFDLVA